MPKKQPKYEHELDVKFKGVGINNQTARISLGIEREAIALEDADDLFSDAQLEACLSFDPNAGGDAEGQTTMVNTRQEIKLTGDVHGFGVKSDRINASLQIPKSSVDVGQLANFANRTGKLQCTRIGSADGEEQEPQESQE